MKWADHLWRWKPPGRRPELRLTAQLDAAKTQPRRTGLPARSATATAAAAAVTATAAKATAAAGGLGTSFVDVQAAAIEFRSVQLRNSRFRIAALGHFYKCKAARLTAVAIRHNVHAFNSAVRRKRRIKFVLSSLITQISDKDVSQNRVLWGIDSSLSDCAGSTRRGEVGGQKALAIERRRAKTLSGYHGSVLPQEQNLSTKRGQSNVLRPRPGKFLLCLQARLRRGVRN